MPPADPVGFGGQFGCYTDLKTGLVLMTYRYYDPVTCRFLTRDPAGYAAGVNPYAYCGGNPVTECDPSGLWPDVGGFFSGVGAHLRAAGRWVKYNIPLIGPLLKAGDGIAAGQQATNQYYYHYDAESRAGIRQVIAGVGQSAGQAGIDGAMLGLGAVGASAAADTASEGAAEDVATGGRRAGRNAFAEEGFSKAKEISTERLIKVIMQVKGESREGASLLVHEIKEGYGMSGDDNLMLDRQKVLWTPTGIRIGAVGGQ